MRFRDLLLTAIVVAPAPVQGAGFERVTLTTTPPVEVGLWYPSPSPVPDSANTPFRQALAMDGALDGENLPLILLSHGNGGWMGGHAHTALALAEAGYIVAAPTHPGDSFRDQVASTSEWMASRPADLSETIDYLVSDWIHADRIDADRIGVFGFSAGGYTALVAAGARLDPSLLAQHCVENPLEFTCRIGLVDGIEAATFEQQLTAVEGDVRVAAISVAAPGFGFGFDKTALAPVTIPVQIWSGASDGRVPHDTNGANIADNLPNAPEVHIVENAVHFVFTAECDPGLRDADPDAWRTLCVDPDGFDRAAFHQVFHQRVVRFFDSVLTR